jgi:hypothetical protein
VSDHDDDGRDDAPEPANLDDYRRRDRPPPPPNVREGYRLDDDGTLYGEDGKPRCSAKARNAPGGVCHTHRIKGATRCRMHGGKSPRAQQKAARDRVEQDMRELLASQDMGPVHDPLTALKELAGEVVGWKDAMRLKVEELDTLDVSTEYGETARAVVQIFERAMDRAGEFLFKIARLNIDDRLAAVTERQAKMIEDGFFDALDEIGIPTTDMATREKVAVAFARHLSVVPA